MVPVTELSSDLRPVGEPVCGVRPIEVPLVVLSGQRRETLFARTLPGHDARTPPGHDKRTLPDHDEASRFRAMGPLRALGTLASTRTGFLLEHAPDFRGPVADLCRAASAHYAQGNATGFREWFAGRAASLDGDLVRHVGQLSESGTEQLMVPLIYLNHMWRQGDPNADAAMGPSRMPEPLGSLLGPVAGAVGMIPRFNQILMTMLAFELDGVRGGAELSHQDIAAVDRMRPAFWLNEGNRSELELYQAFYAVEALGVPLYGWGCHALECAAADDRAGGAQALRMVQAVIRNVYMITKRLIPRIDADEFRRIQVTCGWVGDEVTGVASGYQLPFMLMLDALFHVNYTHPGVITARANNLRFVPEDWKAFFRMVYDAQPALRTWVHESGDGPLAEAYRSCTAIFTLFRNMHRHLGGQVLKGGTTTGRVFDSAAANYEQFMSEMAALADDTAATSDVSRPAAPDSPPAAASRGVRS
ncbi:hypothetical protein IPZ58_29875 [Streptomyces roseoverticillatus]|uniref:hypothetical protein n=1 Tax=Streptomyces roseoverticillatus TaxID=66429 RepID=UPI001F3E1C61|nr:hypothetical protein [Streptomyces roseoverticillatus]MCF3105764.1 hypothetical protein [Streptomyces roseoverticillatus]